MLLIVYFEIIIKPHTISVDELYVSLLTNIYNKANI